MTPEDAALVVAYEDAGVAIRSTVPPLCGTVTIELAGGSSVSFAAGELEHVTSVWLPDTGLAREVGRALFPGIDVGDDSHTTIQAGHLTEPTWLLLRELAATLHASQGSAVPDHPAWSAELALASAPLDPVLGLGRATAEWRSDAAGFVDRWLAAPALDDDAAAALRAMALRLDSLDQSRDPRPESPVRRLTDRWRMTVPPLLLADRFGPTESERPTTWYPARWSSGLRMRIDLVIATWDEGDLRLDVEALGPQPLHQPGPGVFRLADDDGIRAVSLAGPVLDDERGAGVRILGTLTVEAAPGPSAWVELVSDPLQPIPSASPGYARAVDLAARAQAFEAADDHRGAADMWHRSAEAFEAAGAATAAARAGRAEVAAWRRCGEDGTAARIERTIPAGTPEPPAPVRTSRWWPAHDLLAFDEDPPS